MMKKFFLALAFLGLFVTNVWANGIITDLEVIVKSDNYNYNLDGGSSSSTRGSSEMKSASTISGFPAVSGQFPAQVIYNPKNRIIYYEEGFIPDSRLDHDAKELDKKLIRDGDVYQPEEKIERTTPKTNGVYFLPKLPSMEEARMLGSFGLRAKVGSHPGETIRRAASIARIVSGADYAVIILDEIEGSLNASQNMGTNLGSSQVQSLANYFLSMGVNAGSSQSQVIPRYSLTVKCYEMKGAKPRLVSKVNIQRKGIAAFAFGEKFTGREPELGKYGEKLIKVWDKNSLVFFQCYANDKTVAKEKAYATLLGIGYWLQENYGIPGPILDEYFKFEIYPLNSDNDLQNGRIGKIIIAQEVK